MYKYIERSLLYVWGDVDNNDDVTAIDAAIPMQYVLNQTDDKSNENITWCFSYLDVNMG